MQIKPKLEDPRYNQTIIRVKPKLSGIELRRGTEVYFSTHDFGYERKYHKVGVCIDFVRVFQQTQYQDEILFAVQFPCEFFDSKWSINLHDWLSLEGDDDREIYFYNCLAQVILADFKVCLSFDAQTDEVVAELISPRLTLEQRAPLSENKIYLTAVT